MTAFPSIAMITEAIERWAPHGSAQSYDSVGLQIGNPEARIARAIVALDVTRHVIDEAIEAEATLIVTHHPLLFRPLKAITPSTPAGALALRIAEAGIALYSAHTNLDAADRGVSFALAEQLGLGEVRFLAPLEESLYKLVTFVPHDHVEGVRAALEEAGAGHIGNYTGCAFASTGRGYFKPGEGAEPFTGTSVGRLEEAEEVRLEVEVERWRLQPALRALEKAHPYEEVAYDVYQVINPGTRTGMGAIGVLEAPEPLTRFLSRTAQRLNADCLRYVGDEDGEVRTVAVCGGSGSSLIDAALRAGVDAFVTADITYHRYFEVFDSDGVARMALIDAGHYETEAVTEVLLSDYLERAFPEVEWSRAAERTGPVQTFVA